MKKRDSENSILFIGEFPPPYTGVTVKDVTLCEQIFDGFEVERFDLYQFKYKKYLFPVLCLKLLSAIRKSKRICIGVGHPFRTCVIFRLAKLLRGEQFLDNITVFMMGVGTPLYLQKHKKYIPYISKGKCIFAEGESLVQSLESLGLNNAFYLPNFRSKEHALPPRLVNDKVRFVYFARVCSEKGADTLLEAVAKLNEAGFESQYEVDIWGHIAPDFKERFDSLLQPLSNAEYRGVFDAAKGDVYKLLNSYDSSVSSSSWGEGMSGTNIECKFAGIANIVGDGGLNPESVSNGENGYVVLAGNVDVLVEAMTSLIEDHDLLYQMKCASFEDRKGFSTDLWKERILHAMGLEEGSDEHI